MAGTCYRWHHATGNGLSEGEALSEASPGSGKLQLGRQGEGTLQGGWVVPPQDHSYPRAEAVFLQTTYPWGLGSWMIPGAAPVNNGSVSLESPLSALSGGAGGIYLRSVSAHISKLARTGGETGLALPS